MASEVTSTTASAWLKRMYQPKYIQNSICKKSSRAYAMITEKSDCGGDSYNFLSVVNELAAGSANFATAQTQSQNNTTPFGQQYNIPYFESHEPVNVAGDIVLKTKNKEGGWLPALDFSMKSALSYAAHRHSVRFYTSGWGEMGQLTHTQNLASATVTLVDPSTVYRFLPGQWLTFSSALGGALTRGTNTALQITSVNYNGAPGSTGHLTLSAALNTVAAGTGGVIAVDDFIFLQDDRLAAGTSQVQGAGLAAWLPIPGAWFDPAGANPTLYGVNRSVNSRLTGNYVDGRSQSVKASLIQAAQTVSSIGNAEKPVAFVSPNKFTELSQSLDTNQRYVELAGRGSVGFKTITVFADGIDLPVMSDKYCTDGIGYVLDVKDAQVNSCGPAPHIDETDGLALLRQPNSFGYEGRILSLYNYSLNNTAAASQIQFL
jgi:hypothetical protein